MRSSPYLPFSQDEIHWSVTTGTVDVQDRVIPEDEDLSYQTRCKSSLAVVFKIGDGKFEGDHGAIRRCSAEKHVPKTQPLLKVQKGNGKKDTKGKRKSAEGVTEFVYEEPEEEFMDVLTLSGGALDTLKSEVSPFLIFDFLQLNQNKFLTLLSVVQ